MSDRRVITAEDLKRYRFLQRRIEILKEVARKHEYHIAYDASRRTRMSQNASEHKSGPTSREDKLNEIQRILDAFIDESVQLSEDILGFIQNLKDPDASILYCRYVLGLSWRAVASRVHLSVDRCQHINGDIFKRQK